MEYQAPRLVAEAIARELGTPHGQLDVLDAGCGTGLCAPLLKPHARRLVGVDLSAGMLCIARERQEYDDLVQAELTEYLRERAGGFDLIASADTLVYFGELTDALAAAANALRAGGLFVFTLEDGGSEAADTGIRLQSHGRYIHSEDYVRRSLVQAGFLGAQITRDCLRKERDQPVAGLVLGTRRYFRIATSPENVLNRRFRPTPDSRSASRSRRLLLRNVRGMSLRMSPLKES